MQTRKLYYEDPLMQEFTATVCACTETEKGYQVVLDATAFYPEGGGQACDLGTLDNVNVTDVQEQGETVAHLCASPLPVGAQVQGKINWERRLDLMQQHSGEHIVSGIIHKLYGCHNVGFHMGADVITIDFDYPVPAEMLPKIEAEANAAIYQDLPIGCGYPEEAELKTLAYRTKKALPWPVRIVEVPGYDICACCGVHVLRTGQIGLIKLLSCVKFHEGVRIEMVCGARALRYLSRIYEQNKLVSQAFSAKLLETGAAAQRMNDALAAEKFRATALERQVFDSIADGYENKGNVLYFAQDFSAGAIRELADRIARKCGGTAAVFCPADSGYQVCLVNKTESVAELGKRMNENLCGRGGGKPGFFQGSVQATREQIEAFFW